ncbi:hypothetical protein MRX96_049660 [Rhipicephalus microplus]
MKVFTAATIYSFTILVFSASDVDVTSVALFIGLVVVCAFDELTMERPALAARRAAIADDEERFGFADVLHNVKPWSVSPMQRCKEASSVSPLR